MKQILIIQTAFIGDVILATSLVETLKNELKEDFAIDILVRKGNETLLKNHPHIRNVFVWNKQKSKYRNLFNVIKQIRKQKYDTLYNLQRFASTGLVTLMAKASLKSGFKKNPFSFAFHNKVLHEIGNGEHEVMRNFNLIENEIKNNIEKVSKPKLYPSKLDKNKIESIIKGADNYYVIAPASVWYTKQLPEEKWVELTRRLSHLSNVFFIGAPSDIVFIDRIIEKASIENAKNLAGEISLLESAELIRLAKRTFVNDSAPLHLSSAMNAPVTAFFCSTVSYFGFGPLSDNSQVLEVDEGMLNCRPCGLHGLKSCPEGHFDCGFKIDINLAKQ